MGAANSNIVIFENDKGHVSKSLKKNKLIWTYKNGKKFDCDVNFLGLSQNDFNEMYDSMKSDKYGYKMVEHSIIFCNCPTCDNVNFKDNIPKKWVKSVCIKDITYNRDRINYKINGFPSLYKDTINIFSQDFKKIIISFEGVAFSNYILILRSPLEF